MSEEETEKEQPEDYQEKYRETLIARLNKAGYMDLDEASTEALEAIYKRENSKKVEKPETEKFIVAPLKNKEVTPKTEKKENETPEVKFNGLEVFHPQYGSIDNMRTVDNTCMIFTMRVNADSRWPEWQVS